MTDWRWVRAHRSLLTNPGVGAWQCTLSGPGIRKSNITGLGSKGV